MQKNESNNFTREEESRKPKTLPPLNQSPKLSHKKDNQMNQLNLNQVKKEEKAESPAKTSVSRKERKFVVDEYDQKAIIICQFCGGQSCPQEDFRKNKIQPNAIEGLHSNWITQNILATQRPSNRLINEYNLLQIFTKYNINSILNLQEPGEHPYCGDGIDSMIGFSYDPQLFFNNKIRFQNEYWEDMTPTTFEQMMKIMNIFYRSIILKRGKIAVHCHAGRGRTLMAICSWLIYNDRMTAQQTIDLAVLKREGVLTKTSQRDFLRDFQKQLHKRWKSYTLQIEDERIKSFSQLVTWQNGALLKSERESLNQTAFVHGTIVSILRKRMRQQCNQIVFAFIDLNDKRTFGEKKWDQEHQHRLSFLKTYFDKKRLQEIKENQDIRVLVALLQDFYDNLPFTPISLHAIDQIKEELQIEKEIQKNSSQKRKVKKQTLMNKVLKRWQDILKERQSPSKINLAEESKIKQKSENLQNTAQIAINSRANQTSKQPNLSAFNQTGQNNIPAFNSAEYIPGENGFTQSSFQKSGNNFSSQIQINSLYLNVLTQPSIIHEVGLNSLCTFIDFVKLAIQLLEAYQQKNPKQSEEDFGIVQKCLLAKFSLLLQSKKKYFPLLFWGAQLRESNLMKKVQKLEKYSNPNIKYIAESFMKELMEQMKVFLKDETNEDKFKKLILKIQKVNANVEYFSKSHTNSGGKFFSAQDVKKVYDDARI